jgi:hypothetical protein
VKTPNRRSDQNLLAFSSTVFSRNVKMPAMLCRRRNIPKSSNLDDLADGLSGIHGDAAGSCADGDATTGGIYKIHSARCNAQKFIGVQCLLNVLWKWPYMPLVCFRPTVIALESIHKFLDLKTSPRAILAGRTWKKSPSQAYAIRARNLQTCDGQ